MICLYWTNKHETKSIKQLISGMSICRPRHLQLPLQPRTLLIADVTGLQPFTAGGNTFRENIETLVSYNVHTDGAQQDCLYIKQGHLMPPTTFMTYSMVVDPRQAVVVTWTPHLNRDHFHILLLKGLSLLILCHIPQNRREAGSSHARLWSTKVRPRSEKRRPHGSL